MGICICTYEEYLHPWILKLHPVKILIRLSMYVVLAHIQSTLVISNSKGLYETLRDIRNSTYQIYGTEEKTINRTTTFNRMNT